VIYIKNYAHKLEGSDMRWLRFWPWLWKDTRSDWEKKQERAFIDAVNKLKNYSVSDRGALSMDPEGLREQVIASREELKHLVQQPSANARAHAHQSLSASQTAFQDGAVPAVLGIGDFVEVVAWRRLNDQASVRYICLESLTTQLYLVASADYFSGAAQSHCVGLETKVNPRFATVTRSGELDWFDTASEAIDAFDKGM
jgi:hypothetical protein